MQGVGKDLKRYIGYAIGLGVCGGKYYCFSWPKAFGDHSPFPIEWLLGENAEQANEGLEYNKEVLGVRGVGIMKYIQRRMDRIN